jgi:Cytochrome c2
VFRTIAAGLASALIAGGASAQDADAGQRVFARRCATCHAITAPDGATIVRGGRIGPNFYGLIGDAACSQPDFDQYGDSLMAAGDGGLVWIAKTLVPYLLDPHGSHPTLLGDDGGALAHVVPHEGLGLRAGTLSAYLSSIAD